MIELMAGRIEKAFNAKSDQVSNAREGIIEITLIFDSINIFVPLFLMLLLLLLRKIFREFPFSTIH